MDTLSKSEKIAGLEVIAQTSQFVECWEPEKLKAPIGSENEEAWKDASVGMK